MLYNRIQQRVSPSPAHLEVNDPVLAVRSGRPPLAAICCCSTAAIVSCGMLGGWIGDDHCAQGEGHVHAAVEANMANPAAVGTSPVHLQLINDLHGPHLQTGQLKAGSQFCACCAVAA